MDLWRKWSTITKTVDMQPNSDYSVGKYKNGVIRLAQHGYSGIPSETYKIKGQERQTDDNELAELYLEMDQPVLEE